MSIYLKTLNASQGLKIKGAHSNDRSGHSVNKAGDINNDGYADVIIGAPYASPLDRQKAGESYIIFGKKEEFNTIDLNELDSPTGFKIFGANECDSSGTAVSYAGDVNGDGYADVIIGAPDASPLGRQKAGVSYVIFGKKDGFNTIDLNKLDSLTGFSILGANKYDSSGTAVSYAGDINGDKISDVIIGAPDATFDNRQNSGVSYVIFGKKDGFNTIDLNKIDASTGFKIFGANEYDGSGTAVSYAGDINGDKISDVIIGAPYGYISIAPSVGASYVIFGNRTLNFSNIDLRDINDHITKIGFKIEGDNEGDNLGISVGGLGDIDGDQYDDIIVSASSAEGSGVSYVIFGHNEGFSNIYLSDFETKLGFDIHGVNIGDNSGYSVNGIGDFNGDKINDLIIGAPYADPYRDRENAGENYIIFGSQIPVLPSAPIDWWNILYGVIGVISTVVGLLGIYTIRDIYKNHCSAPQDEDANIQNQDLSTHLVSSPQTMEYAEL